MRAPLFPRRHAIVIVLALLSGCIWFWRDYFPSSTQSNDPPRWIHRYPGKGMVYSLAATKTMQGNEIIVAGGYVVAESTYRDLRIVALAADTGSMLWERRGSKSFTPDMDPEVLISFDTDGNVLCGVGSAAVRKGAHRSLTKMSIKDGGELWHWAVESLGDRYPSTGYGHMAQAADIARKHIWVSGIRSLAERTYERVLALVDSQTGRQEWLVSLNAARDGFDRPAEVHTLAASDAVVMSPPIHHEKSFPWIWQRIDEATGKPKWTREFLRDNDRNLTEPFYIVDEPHGQVLIFWHQVIRGRWHGEIVALDIQTGEDRWRKASNYAEIFTGGMRGVSMSHASEAVLLGSEEWTSTSNNWLDWRKDPDFPIPLPSSTSVRHVRPICVSISTLDGRVLSKNRLSEHDEAPSRIIYDSYSQEASAVFVRTMITRESLEPWRAIRLDGVTKTPLVGGMEAKNDYPRVATMTPSGRVITTGDPTEKEVIWRIEAW